MSSQARAALGESSTIPRGEVSSEPVIRTQTAGTLVNEGTGTSQIINALKDMLNTPVISSLTVDQKQKNTLIGSRKHSDKRGRDLRHSLAAHSLTLDGTFAASANMCPAFAFCAHRAVNAVNRRFLSLRCSVFVPAFLNGAQVPCTCADTHVREGVSGTSTNSKSPLGASY